MRLNKTDVSNLDAFTETCKDCIIARQEKRIAELEFHLNDAECKWVGFADENYQLKKQISDLKSLLAEAVVELIHSNRYAQSNEKEQLIAKIVEGYTPKISIF